ncbi:LysR substrate-binding domain-containing protein [Herbaspirillum sp. RV1423]|uniref:LysR substrate-binding domain-containing protein n=1 Tax=Herbaspirillum sp. RV1423 TaxID=1443993 RepID=UPI001E4CC20F|nr:LysR substrate-binding domain-containing protein [Herbaspirillum sp. RV1423]
MTVVDRDEGPFSANPERVPTKFVASKEYLAKCGIPKTPDDLLDHECVIYTLLSSGVTWNFKGREIQVSGRLRVNSPEAARESVIEGLGIGQGPKWLYENGLNDGR